MLTLFSKNGPNFFHISIPPFQFKKKNLLNLVTFRQKYTQNLYFTTKVILTLKLIF
jgi:hypothetical protein